MVRRAWRRHGEHRLQLLGLLQHRHLGGEIREPEKNIPRGIFLSIAGITILYLAMQTSLLGVVPWREAQHSPFIASLFVEKLYGTGAANFVTWMVLWIALASIFSLLLGYSRVPYSAALDGTSFRGSPRCIPPSISRRSRCSFSAP